MLEVVLVWLLKGLAILMMLFMLTLLGYCIFFSFKD